LINLVDHFTEIATIPDIFRNGGCRSVAPNMGLEIDRQLTGPHSNTPYISLTHGVGN
jgi:hypothetical protein